jgi:hypothetical protein
MLGAGGALGTIARGEAPQRGAQPRECRMPVKQAPRGAADSLPYSHQIQFRRRGFPYCCPSILGLRAALQRSRLLFQGRLLTRPG